MWQCQKDKKCMQNLCGENCCNISTLKTENELGNEINISLLLVWKVDGSGSASDVLWF